jgi:hypothetical protein
MIIKTKQNMLPKVLVTTGCSYGKFANVFYHNGIDNVDGLELVIDLSAASLGSTHQMISIIECVDKLLSLGIANDDIFVICQFSETNRRDIVIQNDSLVNEIDNTTFTEYVNEKLWNRPPVEYPDIVTINDNEFTKFIRDNITIKKIFPIDYAKFGNYYIINPERRFQTKIPNKVITPILDNYKNSMDIKIEFDELRIVDRVSIENVDRSIRYFQNILSLEQYLKLKNIKYKFCLINNQFSMYGENGLQMVKRTKRIGNEHCLFQDYINSKQIWDINSMIKILYNMIDWSNWWFYKNEEKNIIWGGIDEFAIDKYGIEAYSQRNTDKNLFGQHPTKQVYQDLIVNHLMKEYF